MMRSIWNARKHILVHNIEVMWYMSDETDAESLHRLTMRIKWMKLAFRFCAAFRLSVQFSQVAEPFSVMLRLSYGTPIKRLPNLPSAWRFDSALARPRVEAGFVPLQTAMA